MAKRKLSFKSKPQRGGLSIPEAGVVVSYGLLTPAETVASGQVAGGKAATVNILPFRFRVQLTTGTLTLSALPSLYTTRACTSGDIEITAAHIKAALRCIAKSSFDTAVPAADMQSATGSSRNQPLPQLSPSFRRVHAEANGVEREPIGDEPFTIVERRRDFEYCVLPAFESFQGLRLVKPRLNGPWAICEGCDNYFELKDRQHQGWFVWIRLVRRAES